jgi:hypothetical protein
MSNLDKIILKGRIFVFYGSILTFFLVFTFLYSLKFNLLISILLSIVLSFYFYLISSTHWLILNILKVDNGHELIEQALFYLIIMEDKFKNIVLLLYSKELKDRWFEIESKLKSQNKNYFEEHEFEDRLTIKSSKYYFNIFIYVFFTISTLNLIYALHQEKFEYAILGLICLLIGFYFIKLKKDDEIKIILDKTGMKVNNMLKMNWSGITNEKLIFSSRGIVLYFKYEKKNMNFSIEQYDIKPFLMLNYIRHFKKYVC